MIYEQRLDFAGYIGSMQMTVAYQFTFKSREML